MIPCPWALIHKSECQSKSRQNRPHGCLSEQLLKNQSSKHRRSWESLDRPLVTWPGRQVIRSDCLITISIPYQVLRGGGGGLPQKGRGGGFPCLNTKPDNNGQPYLTIPYTSQSKSKWIIMASQVLSRGGGRVYTIHVRTYIYLNFAHTIFTVYIVCYNHCGNWILYFIFVLFCVIF